MSCRASSSCRSALSAGSSGRASDDREPEPPRLHRGTGMSRVIVLAGGFLLVSACVIALARSSTARWERERRAARASRRAATAPPTSPPAAAARLRRAAARTAVVAGRAAASIRVPPQAARRISATSRKQAARRVRPRPQMGDAVRHAVLGGRTSAARSSKARGEDPSLADGEASGAVPRTPELSGEARPARRGLRAGIARHDFSSAIPRLTHLLTTGHRHDKSQDPRVGRP